MPEFGEGELTGGVEVSRSLTGQRFINRAHPNQALVGAAVAATADGIPDSWPKTTTDKPEKRYCKDSETNPCFFAKTTAAAIKNNPDPLTQLQIARLVQRALARDQINDLVISAGFARVDLVEPLVALTDNATGEETVIYPWQEGRRVATDADTETASRSESDRINDFLARVKEVLELRLINPIGISPDNLLITTDPTTGEEFLHLTGIEGFTPIEYTPKAPVIPEFPKIMPKKAAPKKAVLRTQAPKRPPRIPTRKPPTPPEVIKQIRDRLDRGETPQEIHESLTGIASKVIENVDTRRKRAAGTTKQGRNLAQSPRKSTTNPTGQSGERTPPIALFTNHRDPTTAERNISARSIGLNEQQVIILNGIAQGLTADKIAEQLTIGVERIQGLTSDLYKKLDMVGNVGKNLAVRAVLNAIRKNLVDTYKIKMYIDISKIAEILNDPNPRRRQVLDALVANEGTESSNLQIAQKLNEQLQPAKKITEAAIENIFKNLKFGLRTRAGIAAAWQIVKEGSNAS